MNGRYNICLRSRCRIPTVGAGRSQKMSYSCSHPPHSSLAVALGMLFHLIYLECSMQQTSSYPSRVAFKISTFHFFPWGLPSVSDFQRSTQRYKHKSHPAGRWVFIQRVGGCRVSHLEGVSITKVFLVTETPL